MSKEPGGHRQRTMRRWQRERRWREGGEVRQRATQNCPISKSISQNRNVVWHSLLWNVMNTQYCVKLWIHNICIYVCAYMYVGIWVGVYVGLCLHVYECMNGWVLRWVICLYVCMWVGICICADCVCVCVCVTCVLSLNMITWFLLHGNTVSIDNIYNWI